MADPATLAILTATSAAIKIGTGVANYLNAVQDADDEREALKRQAEGRIRLFQARSKVRTADFLRRTGTINTIASAKGIKGTSIQAAQSIVAESVNQEQELDMNELGESLKTARLRAAGLSKRTDAAALNLLLGSAGALTSATAVGVRAGAFSPGSPEE